MSQTIEIIVSPKGEATVTTKGFAGATCRNASRYLEEALGQRGGETLTVEFYQPEKSQQELREKC